VSDQPTNETETVLPPDALKHLEQVAEQCTETARSMLVSAAHAAGQLGLPIFGLYVALFGLLTAMFVKTRGKQWVLDSIDHVAAKVEADEAFDEAVRRTGGRVGSA
jgi:hypothetical protein